MKKVVYYSLIAILWAVIHVLMCALAEIDSNEFFKAVNIRLQYIFTDANNSNIGNCEVDYKDFAKE